jgi:phosphopantothenoylcysteine decarboxylase/phosphopantothenate--cysteine ligase
MNHWDFTPPPPGDLGDHDVRREGDHLAGRRVAMLITGGIAAMKTPLLARALRKQGAEVTAFVSSEALRYVTLDALAWSTNRPVVERLTPDAEHLSDGKPFDAYLLPQATYNSLNKIAHGIADGTVSSTMASALGRLERGQCAVLVAPTMHGTMHNAILTESLRKLDALGVRVIPPRQDYGKHNMPDDAVLVAEVCRAVSRSPLRGRKVLATGGPTPVPIDGVRRLITRFTGEMGMVIAAELHLRGADALLIHGWSGSAPPAHLPHRIARSYDDYRRLVHEELAVGGHFAGIFAAAVADYRPRQARDGKIPSGLQDLSIALEPTAKVIDEVRTAHPELPMVTFKYEEGLSHEELMAIAERRLERFEAVVANRGEEIVAGQPHVAWLCRRGVAPERLVGKTGVAKALADYLEALVS